VMVSILLLPTATITMRIVVTTVEVIRLMATTAV